jgi:hypothetical protein
MSLTRFDEDSSFERLRMLQPVALNLMHNEDARRIMVVDLLRLRSTGPQLDDHGHPCRDETRPRPMRPA